MSVALNFTQSAKPYRITCMNKKSGVQFDKEYDSYPQACSALRKMSYCKDIVVVSWNFNERM